MSTKTIAVDRDVYLKLARIKGEGESFSRALDRLLDSHLKAHTGADILTRLRDAPAPLSDAEADAMARHLQLARATETWSLHDLS